uniref:UNC80 domain-containing protein n=1 Tax=Macrostomum lignano TaxID=282301 RepID=A0A1I8HSC2_9PLAT
MQPSVPGSKKLLMMRRTSRDNTGVATAITRGQPSLRKKRDSTRQFNSPRSWQLKAAQSEHNVWCEWRATGCLLGLGVGGSGVGGAAGDVGGIGGDSSGDEAGASELWDDDSLCTYFPWLKAVTAFANRTNFVCEHQKDSAEYAGDKKYSIFRRRSMFPAAATGASPGRLGTRDSTPLLTKLDPAALQKRLHEKEKPEKKGARKPTVDQAMMRYMDDHVLQLTQASFSVICKSCTLLGTDHWCDIMPVAWELLLEADIELATSAATVFLLAAVRIPDQVQELMVRELQHDDVQQRMNAVLRFRSLWMSRFQVWLRLEDGAASNFKIPPPNIEFVLPSPPLGSVNANIPDPPWMPRVKQSVEEVQLKQDEVAKTFVTASTTRRKQQEELMAKEVTAEEQRRRTARERFPLMGQAVCTLAGYEPALFHQPAEEHDE